jgi:hypothetical protein
MKSKAVIFGRLLAFLAISQIIACATPPESKIQKYDAHQFTQESVVITTPPIFNEKDAATYARQFALMALFAKTSYRKDIVDNTVREKSACEYLTQLEHRDVLLDMPSDSNGYWARWTKPGSCYNESGLYFETYVFRNNQGIIEMAVIGIRGTENTSLQQMRNDWASNLSGISPWGASEYERAAQYMTPVINDLTSKSDTGGEPIKIYLTGHSLGGGIAQYIAYLIPSVTAAFTFDTSPVTHWFQLSEDLKKRDPRIYRVYLDGEFLSYMREVTTRLNIRRYQRYDYEFFFVGAHAIEAHDISHLACQFAARIPMHQGVSPNLVAYEELPGYSYASATTVLNNPVICSNEVRAHIPSNFLLNR